MWLTKAAKLGNAAAQYRLGVQQHLLFREGSNGAAAEGRIEALKWVRLSRCPKLPRPESACEFVALGMSRDEVARPCAERPPSWPAIINDRVVQHQRSLPEPSTARRFTQLPGFTPHRTSSSLFRTRCTTLLLIWKPPPCLRESARALGPQETFALMQAPNIGNIVLDEANQRMYVVLAPRVLTDGELYKATRQEILKHGGKHPARGETLTFSFGASANSPAAV